MSNSTNANKPVESSQQKLQVVQDFIRDKVSAHWRQTGTALLLTLIGAALKTDCPESEEVITKGLKRFLTEWQIVRIVEQGPGKAGAVPLDVASTNLSELFPVVSKPIRAALDPGFWRAFRTPIEGRRFVLLSPDRNHLTGIVDVKHGDVPEALHYEILQTDIFNPVDYSTDHVAETWKRIGDWVRRHNLALPMFRRRRPLEDRITQEPAPSSIAEALARLDAQDMARISIPLDLVAKMFSAR